MQELTWTVRRKRGVFAEAVTRLLPTRWLMHNRNVSLTILKAASLGSGRQRHQLLVTTLFRLQPHAVERGKRAIWGPIIRALIPNYLSPYPFPKSPPPNTIILRVRISSCRFWGRGGTQMFSPWCPVLGGRSVKQTELGTQMTGTSRPALNHLKVSF